MCHTASEEQGRAASAAQDAQTASDVATKLQALAETKSKEVEAQRREVADAQQLVEEANKQLIKAQVCVHLHGFALFFLVLYSCTGHGSRRR